MSVAWSIGSKYFDLELYVQDGDGEFDMSDTDTLMIVITMKTKNNLKSYINADGLTYNGHRVFCRDDQQYW